MIPIADGVVGVRQASAPDRLIDNEVLEVGGETVYRQRVQDPEVIALLTSVKTAVEGTLDAAVSGTVALDAATLTALETINVVVSNAIDATVTGEVSLSAATLASLENVTATISGAVALDATTLAALEAVTATIANWPSDFPDATAHSKLDAILAELGEKLEAGQSVALTAATLAALESINTSATVINFPSDYPDSAAATSLAAILSELQQKLEAGQEVALDAATLTALESITAKLQVGGVDVSTGNPLPVDVGDSFNIENLNVEFASVLSTLNVPPAPLVADEVFIGTWEDVKDYASIAIAFYTDVGSATNGAKVQFSADGTNVLREETATVVGGFPSYYEIPPEAQYFRVHYTNGASAQTFLRVSIIFRFNPPGLIHGPLATPSTDLHLAGGVKAHLVGRDTASAVSGVAPWVSVQVDSSGQLYIRSTDLDIRDLSLTDSVRQAPRVMTPLSTSKTGPLTDDVLVSVAADQRIRVLKNSGHCAPDTADGVYPTISLKIGSTTIYTDKLESGLPWNEAVCFEGAAGEDLTLDLSGTSTVYLNIRYELFEA